MISISRRRLALATAALAAALPARAQTRTLNAFGHRVHQNIMNGPGGDVTAAWRTANKAEINWNTLGDSNAVQERVLRELSLAETSLDLVHIVNGRAIPRSLALLEPLDPLQQAEPIEDFADISPGLVAPMKLDGGLRGVPMRHATNALVYNEAIFEERGVAGIPKTFEELMEAARKLTFKRADGTQVFGMVFAVQFAANFLAFGRAFNGDYMSGDGKITCEQPGMVKGVAAIAEMHKAEVLPRNMSAMTNEEITTMIQQGRVAMAINPFARVVSYNDPANSKYPGRIKAALMPMAAELAGKVPYATTYEFWAYAIPKNSKNKALTWNLIRALCSKEGTLKMALNGNGPVRISTYSEAALAKSLPHAAIEAEAIKSARIPLPAFDQQARAYDIFTEESQAAMLGMKTAERAMADAAKRVQPLL
ncbi:MAG: extracellular solute-binding protein [Alphaproteobacteria bacterium]|nr:extracellular solute-binding protein [Alphaproteobacteria bacterium]